MTGKQKVVDLSKGEQEQRKKRREKQKAAKGAAQKQMDVMEVA